MVLEISNSNLKNDVTIIAFISDVSLASDTSSKNVSVLQLFLEKDNMKMIHIIT